MSYSLSMVVAAYNEEELLGSFIRKSVSDLARVFPKSDGGIAVIFTSMFML